MNKNIRYIKSPKLRDDIWVNLDNKLYHNLYKILYIGLKSATYLLTKKKVSINKKITLITNNLLKTLYIIVDLLFQPQKLNLILQVYLLILFLRRQGSKVEKVLLYHQRLKVLILL